MTTYPLSLPSSPTNFATARLSLKSLTTAWTSPLSYVGQVIARPAQVWRGDFALPTLSQAQAAVWKAFIAELRGQYGTFLVGDPQYTQRGTGAGTPLVKGASQTGNSMTTDGWTVATTMLKGDQFQLESRLYIVLADATADGSGNMTVTFQPTLRSTPADNAVITITAPKTSMRLTSDDVPWDELPGGWVNLSFSAVEAL